MIEIKMLITVKTAILYFTYVLTVEVSAFLSKIVLNEGNHFFIIIVGMCYAYNNHCHRTLNLKIP